MKNIYKLISILSLLIRQYWLPNPFENRVNADGYNLIAGIILYPITYAVVGIFYSSNSNPALGSLLYLFFYFVHTGLIALLSSFNFSKLAIYLVIGIYVLILIGIKYLQSRSNRRYY